MELLSTFVTAFVEMVRAGEIEIYNEFSLQHEFGIWLRKQLPQSRIQFERNVVSFFHHEINFEKREIDISVFNPETRELQYAVELKFPRNGRYPETMFDFCKDLKFAEQLKRAGFRNAALFIFAEDELFYQGSQAGIYGFFRGGKTLCGTIRKPTGTKDAGIELQGRYQVEWKLVSGSLRYALISAVLPLSLVPGSAQ